MTEKKGRILSIILYVVGVFIAIGLVSVRYIFYRWADSKQEVWGGSHASFLNAGEE